MIQTADNEPVLVQELLEYIEVCSRTLLTIQLRVAGSEEASKECFIYYSSSLVVKADIEIGPGGERLYVLEELGTPSEAGLRLSVTCSWRIEKIAIQAHWHCLRAGSSNG
ncbi:Uncharacterised protein [Actinobacillus pleuropneumoniae]|nr:Uncharacterised protein [Actinobacillus pleuropneumoniae]